MFRCSNWRKGNLYVIVYSVGYTKLIIIRHFSFSRLYISCDNKPHGCISIVKLDALTSHLEECEFNPKRPVPCEQGCGLIIPKDELKVTIIYVPFFFFT